jgi:hypothetical protein
MREIRQSGSEGGGTEINRSFLPLSDPIWPIPGMSALNPSKTTRPGSAPKRARPRMEFASARIGLFRGVRLSQAEVREQ